MEQYHKIVLTGSNAETMLIKNIEPVAVKFINNYKGFFYVFKYSKDFPIIDVYINNKIVTENQLNKILQNSGAKYKIYKNSIFNETQGNFGMLGDKYLAEFFKKTNEISLNILNQNFESYNKKIEFALEIMLISAHYNYDSIKKGYLSYASHVNGFFTRWKDPNKIRDIFHKNYLNNKEYLESKVSEIIDNNNRSSLSELSDIITEMKKEMTTDIEKGNLHVFNIELLQKPGERDFLEKVSFIRRY
ncbi:hypothetical protein N2V86_25200 [Bacillus sp. FSL R5-0811]|uniref:hypothetical protein n=1 Tax=Bacillus sp. FSL R5-0811 TaxID=2978209 RepID=UPI0030F7E10B